MTKASFSQRLIDWQRQCGRHALPWQNTRDAYRVWLSEIMLQQTQVTTVIPYYERFLERFPSLADLANAPIDAVLELWSGLGYYARARNLHRCAQVLVADYGGVFPPEPERIAELPGIGRSTAAAISVFAFGRRTAILDGNVKRVLARCFGIEGFPGATATANSLWQLAEALLPETDVEVYTQGLMDLGATVCLHRKCACAICPMHEICIARREGRQGELPTARPKKVLPERTTDLLLLTDGRQVLLERRPPVGIWGGLLSLPEGNLADAGEFAKRHGCRLLETQSLAALRHTFTHFHLTIRPIRCAVEQSGGVAAEAGWHWLDLKDVDAAALPTPIRRLVAALGRAA